MFGFEEWDSWLSFGFEVGLSLAIVVGLIFIVRRVNANAEADRQRYLQSRNNAATDNVPAASSNAQVQASSDESDQIRSVADKT